jgi:hypothetical protein
MLTAAFRGGPGAFMSDGEDGKRSSPPGWYPYGEGRQAWWDGEAFGPVAPLAPSGPPQPHFEPHKRRIGKKATIALVLLGSVLAASFVVFEMRALSEIAVGPPIRQAEVEDPTDGCVRTYDLLKRARQTDAMTDAEFAARLRGLRDAAKANDPLLAIDVRDLMEAANGTKVVEILQVIMNRCLADGDLTSDQLAEVGVGLRKAA